MSAALDHEAREVLRLACRFMLPVPINSDDVFDCVGGCFTNGIGHYEFDFDDLVIDDLYPGGKMSWLVCVATDSVGDPPHTRKRVVRVEVSRG